MKKIIFDLDNTLIKWEEKYLYAIKKTVNKYKLSVNYIKINDIIEKYEEYYDYYSKENMLELINNKFNLNLKMNFIDDWLTELNKMADANQEVINVLEYLSKKYEMVVLTNWFKDCQCQRLKKAKIRNYFTEVFGGEEYIKPSLTAFKNAIGSYNPSQCIMIGDNYETDIKNAYKLKMKCILFDHNSKYPESKECTKINDIKQLKGIL